MRKLWIGIAVLVGLQAVAIAIYVAKRGSPPETSFERETLTPRDAPVLAFERIDGARGTLAGLGGRPVLVHFWGTWCEPCRIELPSLLDAARDLDLELLAVAIDDDWPAIRRFFAGRVPSAIVRPDEADVHRRFGARALPDTYVVDANGKLVVRYAGARDWATPAARSHLTRW